jgi:hypothetical protein
MTRSYIYVIFWNPTNSIFEIIAPESIGYSVSNADTEFDQIDNVQKAIIDANGSLIRKSPGMGDLDELKAYFNSNLKNNRNFSQNA